MILKIKNKDYVVETNLKVAYEIEKNKKKRIIDAMSKEDMTLEEMLQFIYAGFKVNNPEIKFNEFQDMIFDSNEFGYVEVQLEFQVFCNLLLSKKETEDEIRKKLNDAINKSVAEVDKDLKEKN